MILMQEYLLSMLWNKYSMGVPITTIIRQDSIPLTPPTLTKMFGYMDMLEREEMAESPEAYQLIYDSLFPRWLSDLAAPEDCDRLTELLDGKPNVKCEVLSLLPNDVATQPQGWRYEGIFPIGKWVNTKEIGDADEAREERGAAASH